MDNRSKQAEELEKMILALLIDNLNIKADFFIKIKKWITDNFVPLGAEVKVQIAAFIDSEILQEQLKHDNTMFSIKPEALEYFHQLYQYKVDFLTGLKNKIDSNLSA